MTRQMEINLLTIFDEAVNKTKAVRDLAKTFEISRDEVLEVLECNDREIPKPKKAPVKKREPETPEPEAKAEKKLPVCNYV